MVNKKIILVFSFCIVSVLLQIITSAGINAAAIPVYCAVSKSSVDIRITTPSERLVSFDAVSAGYNPPAGTTFAWINTYFFGKPNPDGSQKSPGRETYNTRTFEKIFNEIGFYKATVKITYPDRVEDRTCQVYIIGFPFCVKIGDTATSYNENGQPIPQKTFKDGGWISADQTNLLERFVVDKTARNIVGQASAAAQLKAICVPIVSNGVVIGSEAALVPDINKIKEPQTFIGEAPGLPETRGKVGVIGFHTAIGGVTIDPQKAVDFFGGLYERGDRVIGKSGEFIGGKKITAESFNVGDLRCGRTSDLSATRIPANNEGIDYYIQQKTILEKYDTKTNAWIANVASKTDVCLDDGKYVIEYYCLSSSQYGGLKKNLVIAENLPYRCDYGCKDGACLRQGAAIDADGVEQQSSIASADNNNRRKELFGWLKLPNLAAIFNAIFRK